MLECWHLFPEYKTLWNLIDMLSKIKDLESQQQVSPSLISKIMRLKLGSKALTESVSLPRARVHILRNERYQVSLAF